MSSPLKKLASQTALYGLSSIVGRLLNYLLTPLYTYSFTTSQYGVVIELYTYVSFLVVILTYGMETAFFNFSNKHNNDKKVYNTAFTSLLISTLLFVAFATLFSNKIASFLDYNTHPEYIVWFIFIVAIDAVTAIPFALLRSQNKAKRFAFIRLLNIAVNIALNIFYIAVCPKIFGNQSNLIYNPEIGIGYIFISNLIASIFTIVLLIPELKQVKLFITKSLFKKMIIYALPLLVGGLAGMINETLDRVLLKFLLPHDGMTMANIGIYGACYKISIIMTIFIQTFRYAAEPFFFSQAQDKNATSLYATVMHYFVIICSFIFLVTMSYIDVVKYFVGDNFRSGLHIVPVLLIANLCLGIFFNLSIWYKLSGQTKYGAFLTIIGAIITITFNTLLIPVFGYTGAAWATLICYFTIMCVSYFMGQKKYFIPYKVIGTGKYLLLALGMFALQYFVLNNCTFIFKMAVNTLLVLAFMALVFVLERKKIALA